MSFTTDDRYWSGALWEYHAQVVNEGGQGASTISVDIVPGAGNELAVLYGFVTNGDTASRTARAQILDAVGGNALTQLQGATLTAGSSGGIPDSSGVQGGVLFWFGGAMSLFLSVESVADGQDATFAAVCRVRGGVPIVTELGAGTPTVNINTEQTV